MRSDWFDEWADRGVVFFLHQGPWAIYPVGLRQEFSAAVHGSVDSDGEQTLLRTRDSGQPGRLETPLPPEIAPSLRDWLDEQGKLNRPIYA